MKLSEFLNQIYEETWVKIKVSKSKKFDLWMADYVGWYEPVMEEIEPYLDRDIDDEVYTTIEKNPECEDEDDEDAMCGVIHVELRSAKDSKRRADSEILADLVAAIREYNNLLNYERNFPSYCANPKKMTDRERAELKETVDGLTKARKRVDGLIAEANDDKDAHL